VYARRSFIAGACTAALALGVVGQAAGAPGNADRDQGPRGASAKLEVLDRSSERFQRSVEVYRKQEQRRHKLTSDAPESFAPPEQYGVSQSTLDAVASCESGGDPAAVSADGTYRGKYQFDYGTWASMGGSGDPAAAPEAEQDMRAAMLYASAGSSPWPICG
jgi:soluble lytic murein transglycosylase-like protein